LSLTRSETRERGRDPGVERRGVGENGTLAIDDRNGHRDRVGQRLRDRAEAASAEDDLREAVVDLRSSLQPDGLDVEDDPEHGADDLVERGRRRQLDEGKPRRSASSIIAAGIDPM